MTLNRALTAALAFDGLVFAVILAAGLLEKRSDPAGEGLKLAYTVMIGAPFVIAVLLALIPAAPARWAALVVAGVLPLAMLYSLANRAWAPIAGRREATGRSEFPNSPAKEVAAAIAAGDEAALREVVATLQPDLDAQGRNGSSILVFAIDRNPALVRPLLELGADPNRRSSLDELPLEATLALSATGPAAARRLDAAQALLEGGARPDERTRFGLWLLEFSIRNRRPDQVALLLAHGASASVTGERDWTMPMVAVQARQWEVAAELLRRGAPAAHVAQHGETLASVYGETLRLVRINTTPAELAAIDALRATAKSKGVALGGPVEPPG